MLLNVEYQVLEIYSNVFTAPEFYRSVLVSVIGVLK